MQQRLLPSEDDESQLEDAQLYRVAERRSSAGDTGFDRGGDDDTHGEAYDIPQSSPFRSGNDRLATKSVNSHGGAAADSSNLDQRNRPERRATAIAASTAVNNLTERSNNEREGSVRPDR